MSVAGTWYNELGSVMELWVDADGGVTGQYWTVVGDATGRYALVGYADPSAGPTGSVGTGLVVLWKNAFGDSHSVTTWCGQYQVVGGQEHIFTLWLLARETSPSDTWASTIVGADTFQRAQPTPERIALRRARGPASHPS